MLLTCQDRDAAIGRTECAHICLELMNDEAKVKHASNFWMVLKSFGYSEIQEELEGRNVHRLSNVIALDSSLRIGLTTSKCGFNQRANPVYTTLVHVTNDSYSATTGFLVKSASLARFPNWNCRIQST
ncbi:hypothetical protein BT69DRAFT_1276024 [Atractiella rhizophila]|nr:hypothetical protein BT69DRAFT_1276024 [Atractiella rhizophila]